MRRKTWSRRLLLTGLASLLLLAAALGAIFWRPAWYRPAAVDYGRLREDKAALVALEEQISAALNAGREVRFELSAEQVNRWLAARHEIWPELGLDTPGLEAPLVEFGEGQVRMGATWRRGDWAGVVGITLRVAEIADKLVICYEAPRLGALPVPRSAFDDVARALSEIRESGKIQVDNRWVWPNGRRACRVKSLEIRPGVVTAVLAPEAR